MAEQDMTETMRALHLKSVNEKKTKYRMLNAYAKKGQTVFTGSSLMEFFPIEEMQMMLQRDGMIYNRGIAGTTTADFLEAMEECVFELAPSKIFINIGSNDLGAMSPGGGNLEKLLVNYSIIMNKIRDRLPSCSVYVMAYYPVNPTADFGLDKSQQKAMFATRTNKNIIDANRIVEELTKKYGFSFINVNQGLTDAAGNLKKEYSVDGIHVWPNAYAVILENLKVYL